MINKAYILMVFAVTLGSAFFMTSCRGCYSLEGCGRKKPCEKIAEVGKKCVIHSEKKSLDLLEKECMTATRRGKKWVSWYMQCLKQWGMKCKQFRECISLKEQREREKWRPHERR